MSKCDTILLRGDLMSKVLLISDSHRDDDTLMNILQKYRDVPLKIHAGDSCYEMNDPLISDMLVVRGNHDTTQFPEYIVHPPFFICHGHTFKVYHTFDYMIKKAKESHCSIIIHGHTHIPYDQIHEGIRIINPGSILINRGHYGYGTYAIYNTETEEVDFYHHVNHEDVSDLVLADGLQTLAEFRGLINQF